jgi:hypothetical protein
MAGRGAGCWESRLSGSVRGWVTTQNMGEILWHRWGNQAANREDKLHPTFWGVPSLLEQPREEQAVEVALQPVFLCMPNLLPLR